MAEGGGLLNRYTVKSCIGGSNPPSLRQGTSLSYPTYIQENRIVKQSFFVSQLAHEFSFVAQIPGTNYRKEKLKQHALGTHLRPRGRNSGCH